MDPTHEMTVTVEAVDDAYAEMLRTFLIEVTAGGEFAVGELRPLRVGPYAPHGDPEFMPNPTPEV